MNAPEGASGQGGPRSVPEEQLAERLFRVAPDVYRIPLPTDFPVGDVNVYYVDGPDPVLVDTGVAGKRTLEALADALDAVGCGISGIRTLLLTHAHVDHAGSARAIQDLSGCAIHAHPRAHRRLLDVEGTHQADQPWARAHMIASGFAEDTVDNYLSMGAMFLRYARSIAVDPFPVEDGEVLLLAGGRPIRVHETLGHTTNHVVYHLVDTDLLFTADHVLPHITANPTLEAPLPEDEHRLRSLVLFQDSLLRTAALNPAIACPGHAASFTDVAARCHTIRAHQRRRCDKVLNIIRDRAPITRKELSLALFGKVRIWDVYLTISEVQAAVDLLEHEGALRVRTEGRVDLYEAA